MDDTLKHLLEAESQAQARIAAARQEGQALLAQAEADARAAQERFERDRAQLRAPYLAEAQARADQAVAELVRQQEARQRGLRDWAAGHEQAAVDAALAWMLDPAH